MVRIIAGTLKGRRLHPPAGLRLRPTGERVREALFSILGDEIEGLRVLDAYCGTGALGFEALSRGAARVVFVEADRHAAAAVEASALRFGVAERSSVVCGKVLEVLGSDPLRGPFGLVLADPPWALGESERFLAAVAPRVAPGGRIVFERDRRTAIPLVPEGIRLVDSRRWGDTGMDIFLRPSTVGVRADGGLPSPAGDPVDPLG